jgi:8-amino-7-oxononanoate synthase
MDRPSHSGVIRRLQADLDGLASRTQLRHLENVPAANFYSNDYLGLSSDPRLRAAIATALENDSGVSSTGSRLLSGNAHMWGELENEIAEFYGSEAALYFNSGYAANTGLLGSLLQSDDIVFSDSANHASIIDGIRLSRARKVIFPHLDLNALEDALRESDAGAGQKFIVVESVFSMDGDRAPIAALLSLGERYGAELIVDEAHATGVMGPQGRGLAAETGATRRVLAIVHTCGKALASAGAFVLCSRVLKEYLVNHARPFIFSTALPPYIAAQTHAALRIAAEADAERAALQGLTGHLRARLTQHEFDTARSDSQIVPVMLGANERAVAVAAQLRKDGFAVRAIRPPTVPPGSARLRLSLTAKHTTEMLDALVDALVRAYREPALSRSRAGG